MLESYRVKVIIMSTTHSRQHPIIYRAQSTSHDGRLSILHHGLMSITVHNISHLISCLPVTRVSR